LAIVALFAYSAFAENEPPENLSNLSLVRDQDLANTSLIMMAFAVLSLMLPGSANRLTNIIAGLVFSLIALIVLVDGLDVHLRGTYNLMMGADTVIMILIVWFAYKTPRLQT
jgi:hypothetical protein